MSKNAYTIKISSWSDRPGVTIQWQEHEDTNETPF